MKTIVQSFCLAAFLCIISTGMDAAAADDKILTMSTTTSTEASGLLDYLLPEFYADTGITVRVMSKGTGAAIRDGMDGNVDIIFVHDEVREKQFVENGFGTKRYYVMYNDFVIVGPESDPANIRGAKDSGEAFARIAAARAPFVSRGDDSGTHAREKQLWTASGVPVNSKGEPADGGDWYFAIGQGMGVALIFAQEKEGYVLSDRGTYLHYKHSRSEPYEPEVVYEGDDMLKNPYGVIPVNPEKFPHVRYDLADTFAKWLVSQRGQEIIGSYQLHGRPLFFPDAR